MQFSCYATVCDVPTSHTLTRNKMFKQGAGRRYTARNALDFNLALHAEKGNNSEKSYVCLSITCGKFLGCENTRHLLRSAVLLSTTFRSPSEHFKPIKILW